MPQAMRASCKETERIRYGVLVHKKKKTEREERALAQQVVSLRPPQLDKFEFVTSVRYPN